ncbi:MAG: SDR family NAD(P)-dependent oxidoreductase [Candidatus Hodarchaeales archaeon]|jgi:2-deoxy-D-gluconate 3-dehydrogenase
MTDPILSPSISELINLTGKVAIVTGGAFGIGQAICYRLAESGAAVMIVDINLDAAKETASQIVEHGGKAKAMSADASSPAAAEEVIKETIDEFGSIDILVNNAGVYPMSPIFDTTEELWDKVLGLNLKGVFFYTQKIAKNMADSKKGGKIINLASIDGFHPTGNLIHYDASKGGVVMMTKALALELAPHKITVNAVAPGGISTPGADVVSEMYRKQMEAQGMTPEQIEEVFVARVPLGRMGIPDDIAKVILFLASDLSGYMTGVTIITDGGYLLS